MTYPYTYPDQTIYVNGVDLAVTYDLVLIDGFTLAPPEPKVYTIDIPGGDGVIDLTETLSGDVAFNNREQDFVFKCIYPSDFEKVKTRLSNFLHGKRFEYKLSWDEDYIYRGRFTISSYGHIGLARGQLGEITIHVSADPYKYKKLRVYRINGAGGQQFTLESGRKPVRPTIQVERTTTIIWNGESLTIGAGTYRLNDVLFTQGLNNIYINTYQIFSTTWGDLTKEGGYPMTWKQIGEKTYAEVQRLNKVIGDASSLSIGDTPVQIRSDSTMTMAAIQENEGIAAYATGGYGVDGSGTSNLYIKAYRWCDITEETWGGILKKKWTWGGLNYDPGANSGSGLGSGTSSSTGGSNNNSGTGGSGTTGSGSGNNSSQNKPESDTQVPSGPIEETGSTAAILMYEWGDL